MLAIEIRLLTGRYHATPWGRHVNEGEVEWPPSPWRILRALLATGFGKLGWTEVTPSAGRLMAALAARPPVIALPPATAAHTRHFMPPFKGNKDKVLDAFVDVGRGASIGIEWDVELDREAVALLDQLLGGLSYLGRAEAWVEAQRVDALTEGRVRCVAADAAPGPNHERVALLGPLGADEYRSWREERVAAELSAELGRKRAEAQRKGKKPPAKLTAKDTAKVESLYPATLVDALLADTASLQKAGWSQPPGSRWLSYWRHERALAPTPSVGRVDERIQPPTTALLALASDTKNGERLPRLTDAVLRLEGLHKALVSKSSLAADDGSPSPCLIGKSGGTRIEGHRHASLFALCLEGTKPPRIDHVLVHAPMGLDAAAQEALRRVRSVHTSDMRYFVSVVGLGDQGDLASVVPMLRAAAHWESSTPFVAPRHLKPRGKNSLLGQVLAELASRGLPEPTRVELEVGDNQWTALAEDTVIERPAPRWRHFRRARLEKGREPPHARGFGLRLTFAEPRPGPLSLGYGSHFGLGAFVPQTTPTQWRPTQPSLG